MSCVLSRTSAAVISAGSLAANCSRLRIKACSRASSAAGSRNNRWPLSSAEQPWRHAVASIDRSATSRPSGSSTVQFAWPLSRIRECPIARPFTRVDGHLVHGNDEDRPPRKIIAVDDAGKRADQRQATRGQRQVGAHHGKLACRQRNAFGPCVSLALAEMIDVDVALQVERRRSAEMSKQHV